MGGVKERTVWVESERCQGQIGPLVRTHYMGDTARKKTTT